MLLLPLNLSYIEFNKTPVFKENENTRIYKLTCLDVNKSYIGQMAHHYRLDKKTYT